jgi:hypothetical protein
VEKPNNVSPRPSAVACVYLAAPSSPLDTVRRIKIKAFQNSKVREQISFLTDVYRPRLTGSPEFAFAPHSHLAVASLAWSA